VACKKEEEKEIELKETFKTLMPHKLGQQKSKLETCKAHNMLIISKEVRVGAKRG
jgi:hypothetical protein